MQKEKKDFFRLKKMIYYHNCDFCLSCHFNLDWCEPITGFPFMPPASRRHRISPLVNVCPNQHCWSTWSTSHCSINWYQPAAVFNQRCNDSRQRQQEYYGLRDQNSPRAAHVQSYSIIVNLWKLPGRGGESEDIKNCKIEFILFLFIFY